MSSENMSKRKIQLIETKKIIYSSADKLFREYGVDKVSVDQIVEKAGVAKGTFYVHYESKDSLIAEFIMDYVNKLDFDYKSRLDKLPAGTSSSDTLLYLAETIIKIMTETLGEQNLKYFYSSLLSQPAMANSMVNYNRDLYKTFAEVITKGIEKGEFKPELDVEVISRHCVLILRGLTYEWCVRYPAFDLQGETIQLFTLLLTGLKK